MADQHPRVEQAQPRLLQDLRHGYRGLMEARVDRILAPLSRHRRRSIRGKPPHGWLRLARLPRRNQLLPVVDNAPKLLRAIQRRRTCSNLRKNRNENLRTHVERVMKKYCFEWARLWSRRKWNNIDVALAYASNNMIHQRSNREASSASTTQSSNRSRRALPPSSRILRSAPPKNPAP